VPLRLPALAVQDDGARAGVRPRRTAAQPLVSLSVWEAGKTSEARGQGAPRVQTLGRMVAGPGEGEGGGLRRREDGEVGGWEEGEDDK